MGGPALSAEGAKLAADLPLKDFVQQQPESSSTRRHSKEWIITIEQNYWIDKFLVILNTSRGGVQQEGPLKDRRFLMRTTR